MVGVCQVQNRVAEQHQQLLVLASEEAGQRLFTGLNYDAFPDPLPELRLRRPKLFSIAAHYERRFLFAFFLHLNTPRPLHDWERHTGTR